MTSKSMSLTSPLLACLADPMSADLTEHEALCGIWQLCVGPVFLIWLDDVETMHNSSDVTGPPVVRT